MTEKKEKTKKLYELVGTILGKTQEKVYNKDSKYHGNNYYKLTVKIVNWENINFLYIFADKLASEQIWKDIQESNYFDKKFIFYCHNHKGNYGLVNWKELKDHGSN